MRQFPKNDWFNTVKIFSLGFLVAWVLFAGRWTIIHWKAVAVTLANPEIVEKLEVKKTFSLK